jgi:hypothetical protein
MFLQILPASLDEEDSSQKDDKDHDLESKIQVGYCNLLHLQSENSYHMDAFLVERRLDENFTQACLTITVPT